MDGWWIRREVCVAGGEGSLGLGLDRRAIAQYRCEGPETRGICGRPGCRGVYKISARSEVGKGCSLTG